MNLKTIPIVEKKLTKLALGRLKWLPTRSFSSHSFRRGRWRRWGWKGSWRWLEMVWKKTGKI